MHKRVDDLSSDGADTPLRIAVSRYPPPPGIIAQNIQSMRLSFVPGCVLVGKILILNDLFCKIFKTNELGLTALNLGQRVLVWMRSAVREPQG